MVSKIDMRTGINPGDPCPFKGMNSVRCRWGHDDDPFDSDQYACECRCDQPAPQTKVV